MVPRRGLPVLRHEVNDNVGDRAAPQEGQDEDRQHGDVQDDRRYNCSHLSLRRRPVVQDDRL